MSCYEWESGEFVLPTAAVATVKKVLREVQNSLHGKTRLRAIALHKELKSRSRAKYFSNVREFERKGWNTPVRYSSFGGMQAQSRAMVDALALEVLDRKLRSSDASVQRRQPTLADVNAVVPAATNKTTEFSIIDEAGVSCGIILFKGRTVHYGVSKNNHAVDRANESPIVHAFDTALGKVKWTRGTGGQTVGNDEYSSEDRSFGGGGNYMCRSYGPSAPKRRGASNSRALIAEHTGFARW